MPKPIPEPAEVHLFYELTYGKWHSVLRYRIPYRDGFADFHGESHYQFNLLMRELVWMFGSPQDWAAKIQVKTPVRWYPRATVFEDEVGQEKE